jgi:fatty acid desaturase
MKPKRVRFARELKAKAWTLARTDNWHNWLAIGGDYAVIVGSLWLFHQLPGVLTYLLALLLISSRMRALDNLTHEASHRLLFKNRRLNDWAGMLLCSFPVGTSPHAYTRSHMTHHNKLGDPMQDPDLIRMTQLGVNRFPLPKREIVKHLGKVLLLIQTPRYLKGAARAFLYAKDTPASERVAFGLYWATVLTLVTVFGLWPLFLLLWVVPYLTGFQILRYLAEISATTSATPCGGCSNTPTTTTTTSCTTCFPAPRISTCPGCTACCRPARSIATAITASATSSPASPASRAPSERWSARASRRSTTLPKLRPEIGGGASAPRAAGGPESPLDPS